MKIVAPLLAGILVAVALVACGEDREGVTVEGSTTGTGATSTTATTATTPAETPTPGEAGETVTLKADASGELAFDQEEITVDAGTVKFVFENPSTLPHALEIEGNGVEEKTPTIRQNGTADLTVDLEAGEYEFYCPVGGHQEAGMEGTLTVR